jgi:hypothetical protein
MYGLRCDLLLCGWAIEDQLRPCAAFSPPATSSPSRGLSGERDRDYNQHKDYASRDTSHLRVSA